MPEQRDGILWLVVAFVAVAAALGLAMWAPTAADDPRPPVTSEVGR